jgi:cyclophilin family peptidyl-prolyl cis-trans isomerase
MRETVIMNKQQSALVRLATIALLVFISFPQGLAAQGNPGAIIHTSMGDIQLELYREQAPVSVENFISYANSGFYDGTIFHRVISHFMIQGGGFTLDMQKKVTGEAIRNEAANGISNSRGTVAMARTNDPHSATAQFFISVQNNPNLDYAGERNSREWGYAVFARVSSGMDVVDEIRFVETRSQSGLSDVPVEPVVIESIEIIDG